jgi:hypothetical protein
VELKRLRDEHPELETAVDMQIALIELQRRVQARVPMPWVEVDPTWLKEQQVLGHPLLRFSDIPLDWTELRLMFRQTADILRRFDAMEAEDYEAVQAIARSGNVLEPLVVEWYEKAALRGASPSPGGSESREPVEDPGGGRQQGEPPPTVSAETGDQLMLLAMKPFLERCAEVVQQRADFSTWAHPYCPLCGGEAEFAVITPSAERHLICSRCSGRWLFHPLACPYCGNDDRTRITSFASRDARYRIYACDICLRYLKAYDARNAPRPVMVAVDAIATLPLDAAAMQRGYKAE